MARDLKPVSFNDSEHDQKLLNYIDGLGVKFSSYVKLLIQRDMDSTGYSVNSTATEEMADMASSLREIVHILKSGAVSIGTQIDNETVATIETDDEVIVDKNILKADDQQKQAMQNVLAGFGVKR